MSVMPLPDAIFDAPLSPDGAFYFSARYLRHAYFSLFILLLLSISLFSFAL